MEEDEDEVGEEGGDGELPPCKCGCIAAGVSSAKTRVHFSFSLLFVLVRTLGFLFKCQI